MRLERVNSHVEIVISDTGYGISGVISTHIFERFRQPTAARHVDTAGLVSDWRIARHLSKCMAVLFMREPGEGKGSTFRVKYRYDRARRTELGRNREPPHAPRACRSYIADSPASRLSQSTTIRTR